jgi:hypothetical protein
MTKDEAMQGLRLIIEAGYEAVVEQEAHAYLDQSERGFSVNVGSGQVYLLHPNDARRFLLMQQGRSG